MKFVFVALVGCVAANSPNAALGREAGASIVDMVRRGVVAARAGDAGAYASAVGAGNWLRQGKAGEGKAEPVVAFEGGCEIDYSKACPDGWNTDASGNCAASTAYGGACDYSQSFAEANEAAKAQFAQDCGAPWPCASSSCGNGHDYDGCPEGWSAAGNGVCKGSAGGAGCNGAYRFSRMSVSEKRDLALACGHSWPCKEACF